jgi:hypothetical protein
MKDLQSLVDIDVEDAGMFRYTRYDQQKAQHSPRWQDLNEPQRTVSDKPMTERKRIFLALKLLTPSISYVIKFCESPETHRDKKRIRKERT